MPTQEAPNVESILGIVEVDSDECEIIIVQQPRNDDGGLTDCFIDPNLHRVMIARRVPEHIKIPLVRRTAEENGVSFSLPYLRPVPLKPPVS